MDSRHPPRGNPGGGGSGNMPGMPGMGIPPQPPPPGGPGGGGLPPHHHIPHPPHHHGPPQPPVPHYDDRDRMPASGPSVGRIRMQTPPLSDPYYAHHQQQHQQHQQQHPQHHQAHPHPQHPQAHSQHPQHPQHPQHSQHPQHPQHSQHPQHPQHPHPQHSQHPQHPHPQHPQHPHQQPPPHHGPHPPQTRHYKEHSRSPEAERMSSSYRPPPPSQQRNDPLTPLSLTSRSPVGPPPSMYPIPRTSTPEQQHSRAPSLSNSPAVYRGPHHPAPPPQSHAPHHPHPSHPSHQMGPESMMNPPPPHHRGMPPPSPPHHGHTPLQPPAPPPPQTQPQHQPQQQQPRQPPPPPGHPTPSAPYQTGRDLPSISNIPPPRQTSGMSISAMLDGPAQPTSHSSSATQSKPPPPPPASEYPQPKRAFTPDYPGHQNGGDRSRNMSIVSSPGVMSNPGYPPSVQGRATPEHPYRPHIPHPPSGMLAASHGIPPRPLSQPIAPSAPQSLSSVLHQQQQDDVGHRGHARSSSYHDRERDPLRERDRDREREREMRERQERERQEREQIKREMHEREMHEREREMREMREREMRERELRERELREREREMREREMREREMREREMRERDMREREMREMREREMMEEMREREMRERERDMHIREIMERELREKQVLQEREMREMRERNIQTRERELRKQREDRDMQHERERERLSGVHSMAGVNPSSPRVTHHPHQHPLANSAYHSHPMTSTSNAHPSLSSAGAPQSHGPNTPMVSGIATLPPQASTQSHVPPQTSSSYQTIPFSGYTTTMPPSPFALQPTLPALPPPGEVHDRRRQGYADNQHGRAEELLYSKQMNERKVAAQSVAQAQIDRKNPLLAMGGYDMGADQKRALTDKEKEEEARGRVKEKERDDEDASTVSGKKRRHHHHHPHHHHNHHHHHDEERFALDGGPLHPQSLIPSKRALTPTVTTTHHHHHAPPHRLHSPAPHRHHSPAPPPAKRPKLVINNDRVIAQVADCPRYHLGSMVYQPSAAPQQGMSTTTLIPRFENRENCIFQVRIPRRFLYDKERAEVCQRRCLWGTDIYTDDSDILAVLVHLGKIPPVLPEGVEPSMVLATSTIASLGKAEDVGAIKKGRGGTNAKGKSIVTNGSSSNALAPPAFVNLKSNGVSPSETNYLNINKDIVVDILILPPLEKYSSTVRNALKSRSWVKQHDGMSFMVHSVKNVEPGEAEGRGKSMRKQRLNEREHIRKWGTLPGREGEGGLRLVGWDAKVGA